MKILVLCAHALVVVMCLARRGVSGWGLIRRQHSLQPLFFYAPSSSSAALLVASHVNRNVCGAGRQSSSFSTATSAILGGRHVRSRHYAAYKDRDRSSTKENDDHDNDDENDSNGNDHVNASMLSSSDWFEAELTLRSAPEGPNPKVGPHQVATLCCRSLQWIDYPTSNAGLRRCYRFFTPECRKLVTGRQYVSASTTSTDSVESFCQYAALSPALMPFMGATRVEVGEATITAAQPPARGALASFSIVIRGAPVLSVQHASGMARRGVASSPPTTNVVMRLEEQRRPPHQGCWMVREIMDVRHAFAGDMGNAHVGE